MCANLRYVYFVCARARAQVLVGRVSCEKCLGVVRHFRKNGVRVPRGVKEVRENMKPI